MKTAGITFNYDEKHNRPVSCTVTIMGDHDEYMGKIRSLVNLLRSLDENMLYKPEIVDICDLILDMLPSSDQLIVNNPNKTPAL
ncbi:MAG: hypothetical protein KDC09_09760 [Bacteroidales bacterium]|nr:hypothetical protein [Bacteroidales bacterium]